VVLEFRGYLRPEPASLALPMVRPPPKSTVSAVCGEGGDQIGVYGHSDSLAGVVAITGTGSPPTSTSYGLYADGGTGVGAYATSSGNDGIGVLAQCAAGGVAVMALFPGAGIPATGDCAIHGDGSSVGGIRGLSTTSYGVSGSSVHGIGGTFTGGQAQLHLTPSGRSGKPTSGAHDKGDLYLDSTGKLFICTESGTPGHWARVNVTAV